MYAGRVIEQGPIRSVLSEPRHPYTAGLLASLPARSEAGADLPQIPGAPPSMLALPKGCAFAPRCGIASPACEADPDPTLAADRLWRCHHPQGIAA